MEIQTLACAGCHLHWLAVVLLPVALWVFKIFRHKGEKCPCDCHNSMDDALRPVEINVKKPYCKPPKPMTKVKGSYLPPSNMVLPPKRKYITEGNIKRGGVNPMPTSPKPPAKPFGQK